MTILQEFQAYWLIIVGIIGAREADQMHNQWAINQFDFLRSQHSYKLRNPYLQEKIISGDLNILIQWILLTGFESPQTKEEHPLFICLPYNQVQDPIIMKEVTAMLFWSDQYRFGYEYLDQYSAEYLNIIEREIMVATAYQEYQSLIVMIIDVEISSNCLIVDRQIVQKIPSYEEDRLYSSLIQEIDQTITAALSSNIVIVFCDFPCSPLIRNTQNNLQDYYLQQLLTNKQQKQRIIQLLKNRIALTKNGSVNIIVDDQSVIIKGAQIYLSSVKDLRCIFEKNPDDIPTPSDDELSFKNSFLTNFLEQLRNPATEETFIQCGVTRSYYTDIIQNLDEHHNYIYFNKTLYIFELNLYSASSYIKKIEEQKDVKNISYNNPQNQEKANIIGYENLNNLKKIQSEYRGPDIGYGMMKYQDYSFIVGNFEKQEAHGRCTVFDCPMRQLKAGYWERNILIEELNLAIPSGIDRFEVNFIAQIEKKFKSTRSDRNQSNKMKNKLKKKAFC